MADDDPRRLTERGSFSLSVLCDVLMDALNAPVTTVANIALRLLMHQAIYVTEMIAL
jgi:hypothetical protein